jgi:hypothetical protein
MSISFNSLPILCKNLLTCHRKHNGCPYLHTKVCYRCLVNQCNNDPNKCHYGPHATIVDESNKLMVVYQVGNDKINVNRLTLHQYEDAAHNHKQRLAKKIGGYVPYFKRKIVKAKLVHRSRSKSPIKHSRSKSPIRRVRSITPIRCSRSKSPIRRVRSITPIRCSRSKSPIRRVRSITPIRCSRSKSPIRQLPAQLLQPPIQTPHMVPNFVPHVQQTPYLPGIDSSEIASSIVSALTGNPSRLVNIHTVLIALMDRSYEQLQAVRRVLTAVEKN